MAITVKASGTQTATISTEHSLLATTDPGSYVFTVDLNAMQAGDVVELRVKRKVLTGGTVRGYIVATFSGVQSADGIIKASIPLASPFGGTFTLKQTAGTGRAFDWEVAAL